ncbi:hypothetical protein JCM10207_008995 [Rhodosporidiobolus poonsookiae]
MARPVVPTPLRANPTPSQIVSWDRSWDKYLAKAVDVKLNTNGSYDEWTAPSAVWQLHYQRDRLCRRIITFKDELMKTKNTLNLLPLWNRCDDDVREMITLTAFVETEKRLGGVAGRSLCPDLTSASLKDKQIYYRCIDTFIHTAFQYTKADGFIEIVSDVFDKMYAIERDDKKVKTLPDSLKRAQEAAVLARHIYLFEYTLSLSAALLGPANFSLTTTLPLYVLFKPVAPSTLFEPGLPPPNPHLALGEAAPRPTGLDEAVLELLGWEKEEAERTAASRCYGCGRGAKHAPELVEGNQPLQVCGGCRKVDRMVTYCSRDCQSKHYKLHKRICGKPLANIQPIPSFEARPRPPPIGIRWQYENMRNLKPTLYHFTPVRGNASIPLDQSVLPMKVTDNRMLCLGGDPWETILEELEQLVDEYEWWSDEITLETAANFGLTLLDMLPHHKGPRITHDDILLQLAFDFRIMPEVLHAEVGNLNKKFPF